MMGTMLGSDDLSIDCNTCVATGTTACNDCLVTHVLANESGPIELVPAPPRPAERAIELFVAAGLVDDPPVFVGVAEFEGAAGVAGAAGDTF